MNERADASAHDDEAAVLQMLIEVLPQVAREVAGPISALEHLPVISSAGAGSLPRQVTDNAAQTLRMVKSGTGLDLRALVERSATRMAAGLWTAPTDGDATGSR
jgi:flotillin